MTFRNQKVSLKPCKCFTLKRVPAKGLFSVRQIVLYYCRLVGSVLGLIIKENMSVKVLMQFIFVNSCCILYVA